VRVACNLCFAERTIYTQEVLAVVMQQLMDTTPLPTLLMRTVIQSLAMYPKLIGFVMNIMQRLIIKQARVTMFCSVLFFSLSRPRSEGWPHHGCTFSIYFCPLSF